MSDEIDVKSFPNGIFGATTYLVYDKKTLQAAIIDCTCSVNEIEQKIKEKGLNLKYILITHGHFDHVYCIKKMKEKFPSSLVFMHKDDLPLLKQVEVQCSMAGIEGIEIPCIDGLLDEKTQKYKMDNIEVKLLGI